jgi:hypothetical protein
MYKTFVTLFFLFISVVGKAHDTKMASFVLSNKNDQLILKAQFIKEDFDSVLSSFGKENDQKYFEKVKNYIKENFNIKINDRELNLKFMSQSNDKHFLKIEVSLGEFIPNIQKIAIWNTCLINDFSEQINIVYLKFKNKTRGFKMDKKRTSIEVVYDEN